MQRTIFHTLLSRTLFMMMCVIIFSLQNSSVKGQAIPDEAPVEAIIIANVGFTDVVSKENGGVYSGTYSLQGRMGLQNGINVGVVAINDKGAVLDMKIVEKNISIQQGELRRFVFSYTPTKYLNGKIKILLKVETTGGVVLGVRVLGEKAFTSNISAFTCASGTKNEGMSMVCTRSEKGPITMNISSKSLFALSAESEVTKTGEKNEKITLPITLPPGKYFAVVSGSESEGKSIVPFTVAGSYGSFLNLNVKENEKGTLTVTSLVKIAGVTGTSTVEVLLTSSEGKNCGKGSFEVTSAKLIALFDVTTSCKEGVVTAKLIDSSSKVLDTKQDVFNVTLFKEVVKEVLPKTIPKTSGENVEKGQLFGLFGMIGLTFTILLLVGVLSYFIKNKKVLK